jgi:hypothetical protein
VKRGTGQIQVTTGAAVQAMVDGVPMPFTTEQGYVMDVTSGTHQLEIYNLLGQASASQSVDVPSGKRVMFTLGKGGAEVEIEAFDGRIRLLKPGEPLPEGKRKQKDD